LHQIFKNKKKQKNMSFLQSLFGTATKKYTDVRGDEFLNLLGSTKNAVLIDVRTPAEFAGGKVKGAVNMDIYSPNFAASIDKLDKSKTYFVYCRSGARSGQACNLMAERGFENLYNLSGGISSL
jgi:rhodanese-related sulfurtransferase